MTNMVLVHAKDYFDDDNGGYIYGIEYYDYAEDMFPMDVEWFKTEEERTKSYLETLKYIKENE